MMMQDDQEEGVVRERGIHPLTTSLPRKVVGVRESGGKGLEKVKWGEREEGRP